MKKLLIDFAPPRRSPTRLLGHAALALGVAALLLIAWQYKRLTEERLPLQAEQRRLQALERQGSDATVAATDSLSKERLDQVALAAIRLGTPWTALLNGIEGSVSEHVTLLGLEPDVTQGTLLVRGEARDIASAFEWVRRIDSLPMIRDAHLDHHLVNLQDSHRPVQFMLTARWLASGAASQGRGARP